MTLTEAAELLDVSVSTVSRIVSGERRPSMELMFVIEERLGWPFNEQADEVRCASYHDAFRRRVEDWNAA